MKKVETVRCFETCSSAKKFPFEPLIIKIHLHDATGCGLNCVAGWLFSKLRSCHKTRGKFRKQPGIARVCGSGEWSQSRGMESSQGAGQCWG